MKLYHQSSKFKLRRKTILIITPYAMDSYALKSLEFLAIFLREICLNIRLQLSTTTYLKEILLYSRPKKVKGNKMI